VELALELVEKFGKKNSGLFSVRSGQSFICMSVCVVWLKTIVQRVLMNFRKESPTENIGFLGVA